MVAEGFLVLSLQTKIFYILMVTILFVLTVNKIINQDQKNVGYDFMMTRLALYARNQAEHTTVAARELERGTEANNWCR